MTRPEFASVIAGISAAIGKDLSEPAIDVYFRLLGDLPSDTFQLAADRVLTEHKWATFPSIAELREAAVLSIQGNVTELSPAEAWELAWKAIGRIDLDVDGSKERGLKGLPKLVLDSIDAFGLAAIIGSESPVEVVRAQFVAIFGQLAARQRRLALLPPTTFTAIVNQRQRVAGYVEALADRFAMPSG